MKIVYREKIWHLKTAPQNSSTFLVKKDGVCVFFQVCGQVCDYFDPRKYT